MSFFAGTGSEFLRVEGADVGGVGFGPAGGGIFLHGNGKFRMRVSVGGEEAAGISESELGLAVRIDAGGDLAFFDGEVAGAADGAGPLFGGKSGGVFGETIHGAIALLCGHGEEARIFGLTVGEGERSFDGGAEGIFVDAIGGGTGGAAVGDSSNGNCETVLGDVLVDGVVGEAGESVGDFVNVDFGFFGSGGFCETKNGDDDFAEFALVEKIRGRGARGLGRLLRFGGRFHWLENAVPMRTFRKREGDAP